MIQHWLSINKNNKDGLNESLIERNKVEAFIIWDCRAVVSSD